MSWTEFWDMCTSGGQKLDWARVYIEAPCQEAEEIFRSRFGRDPNQSTCDCCGEDYAVQEFDSLEKATAFHRGYDDESLEEHVKREELLFIHKEDLQ